MIYKILLTIFYKLFFQKNVLYNKQFYEKDYFIMYSFFTDTVCSN
jgi:hypothetical protein